MPKIVPNPLLLVGWAHGVAWSGWLVMALGIATFWAAILWLVVIAVRSR